jgi:uncharacterized protein DUF1553
VTECYRRSETTLPQQALALANSTLTLRQARLLARALDGQVGSDQVSFVTSAFERVLSRPPTRDELAECLAFLSLREQKLARTSSAGPVDKDGSTPARNPALRARENLVHVLLNHHDFVMIR